MVPDGIPEKNPIDTLKDAIKFLSELEHLTDKK